jgi:methyltransferase-like protein/protein-L-isoaspartate O-methyltransferase
MKTLEDYDQLPYSDCPIKVSRPDNLYRIGRLFHLQPQSPANCKVLEIGCAGGGNLIPLAYYWPESKFVGVELSRHQAAQANQVIQELQLSNIQVLHRDLLSVDHSLGQFDYIIAHGVYSWVPAEVQQYLLKLCTQLLAPNGIAYISYNTLPGWESRNMLREMMRYHSRNATTVQEQLAKSLELLHLLHQGLPENGSLSERWLRLQAEELLNKPPNYVYHDYLEKFNTPVYFHQFAEQVSRHQLQYFAEASIYTMLSSTLTAQAENALDQFEDPLEYEQYMDFFYLKHFRQSLLCHATCKPQRDIQADILKAGYFYSDLYIEEDIDLFSPNPQTFTSPGGDSYSVSHPLSKAALAELLMAYPATVDFDNLTRRAADTVCQYGDAQFSGNPDVLFNDLVNLYLSGAIDVSSDSSTAARQFGAIDKDQPKFNALTRAFSRNNKFSVATVHHDSVVLNPLQRQLIALADGTHDAQAIATGLSQAMRDDEALQAEYQRMLQSFQAEGLATDTVDPEFVRQIINSLANLGLLDEQ